MQLNPGHAGLVGCAIVDLDLERIDRTRRSRKQRDKGRERNGRKTQAWVAHWDAVYASPYPLREADLSRHALASVPELAWAARLAVLIEPCWSALPSRWRRICSPGSIA